ncbi:hypothetical protein Tco_0397349 [Tanacetum coccineum]
MLTPKPSSYYTGLGKSSFANLLYLKKAQKEKPCLYNVKYDKNDLANLFAPESDETIHLAKESRSKLCKTTVKPYDYTKQNSLYELFTPQTEKSHLKYVQSLKKEVDELQTDKTELSKEYDLLLQECVSKDIITSNVKDVCATCGKCVFNSNHDACVSKFINDVNDRTKKPKVDPISASKPIRKANQSVPTPHKKTIALESTIQKSKSYFRMLFANTSKAWTWWIEKQCPSGYKWMRKTKKKWVPKIRTENVSTSISPTIDIASRITNDSSPINDLRSNLSNAPLSSNSLADSSNYPMQDPMVSLTMQSYSLNFANLT